MENETSFTYTSPASGVTYDVIPTNASGWFRYDIYRNGQKIQFALTESNVAKQVKHYEQPGFDGWYCTSYD